MMGAVLYFAYTTDRDLRGCDCLRSGEVVLNSFYSRIGPDWSGLTWAMRTGYSEITLRQLTCDAPLE